MTRALALTQEIDARAKNAVVGPLLRAQIFTQKGQTQEAAAAYAEALARNPRQPEARLQLARLSLQNDQTDEAIRQARYLQDADPDKPTGLAALLVEARATAIQKGSVAQVQANRAKALDRLDAALRDRPDFAEAAYLTAEIQLMNGDRARAVATLKTALKTNPNDATALAMAIQVLAEPRGKGQRPEQGRPRRRQGLAERLRRQRHQGAIGSAPSPTATPRPARRARPPLGREGGRPRRRSRPTSASATSS